MLECKVGDEQFVFDVIEEQVWMRPRAIGARLIAMYFNYTDEDEIETLEDHIRCYPLYEQYWEGYDILDIKRQFVWEEINEYVSYWGDFPEIIYDDDESRREANLSWWKAMMNGETEELEEWECDQVLEDLGIYNVKFFDYEEETKYSTEKVRYCAYLTEKN